MVLTFNLKTCFEFLNLQIHFGFYRLTDIKKFMTNLRRFLLTRCSLIIGLKLSLYFNGHLLTGIISNSNFYFKGITT